MILRSWDGKGKIKNLIFQVGVVFTSTRKIRHQFVLTLTTLLLNYLDNS